MCGTSPKLFTKREPQCTGFVGYASRASFAKAKQGVALLCCLVLCCAARAQTVVQDVFGRSLNQRGITLVDWDGYMANPLIKLYLLPPTNAALPGYATLSANGSRLYFDNPGSVSATGPATTRSFASSNNPVPVNLSLFPAHISSDGSYTLTVVFTDAHNASQTNTLPISVIDQDTHHSNDFFVTVNFDRDVTQFFTNPVARLLVNEAANDWTYYFTGMNLDPVLVGIEQTYIWSNNFDGGYYFDNTNTYIGYQLYAYGTTNSALRSGGEANFYGGDQTSGGIPLTIHRSGGFEANIVGNYNTLYWLFLTNDDDWLLTANLGSETNDFFSIAHHEIGHALIFNEGHPGFSTALANGAFTSEAVTNYYGGPVPIDASNDHLTGVIDPESGQGAFGYEYYGEIPRYRWTMTKIDLLCAQEVGYTLRSNSAFAPFAFPTVTLPDLQTLVPYTNAFIATGGIPVYNWDIPAGALPPGLGLDPFTGVLSGTPSGSGVFNFAVRVRDYHENSAGLTQAFSLNVGSPVHLSISLLGNGTNPQTIVSVFGTVGQRHVLQASTDLNSWTPLVTNILATNLFQYTDTNAPNFTRRYYRSSYTP
jgi:hypothetical protein